SRQQPSAFEFCYYGYSLLLPCAERMPQAAPIYAPNAPTKGPIMYKRALNLAASPIAAVLFNSLATAAFTAAALAPTSAAAFCGFFVSGADAALSNNASQVVLLRKGNHTVMSMSNNYKGPPEDFAMVVPVPVVLKKEQVKTLAPDIFAHIDQLS